MIKQPLLLALFFAATLGLGAQSWETVRMETFDGLAAPGATLDSLPDFAYSTGLYGQPDSSGDWGARGSYIVGSFIAIRASLSPGYEYRLSLEANSASQFLPMRFYYNSIASFAGAVPIGETQYFFTQNLDAPGTTVSSSEFPGLDGVYWLLAARPLAGSTGIVHFDGFTLERRSLAPPALYSFTTDSLQAYAGDSLLACVRPEAPPAQAEAVSISLQGGAAPHFSGFSSPLTLQFAQGDTAARCFTLAPAADSASMSYAFRIDTAHAGANAELQVLVEPCPGFAGADREVCAGSGTRLGCDVEEAPSLVYCYRWLPEDGLDDPSLARPWATPAQTTVYTVYVTTSDGALQGVDEVVVTVEHPELEIFASSKIICSGSSSILYLEASADTYEWYYEGSILPGETASSVIVNAGGHYEAMAIKSNGCTLTGEISLGDSNGPDAIATVLSNEGFACISVEIVEDALMPGPVNRAPCSNYVEDRTDGLGFRFPGSPNIISNLGCLLDQYLNTANVCGNQLTGLITKGENICQEPSFFETNDTQFLGVDAGYWIHFIDRPGPDDCMMIRANTTEGVGTEASYFSEYVNQLLSLVSTDAELYGYASKDEQLIDIIFNEALSIYVDSIPVLADQAGVSVDNFFTNNLPLDDTPLAPVGPCTQEEPLVGISPSGMPVWVESGARISFGSTSQFKDKIDKEALTAFTLNTPGGYKGRFRAGVKSGCEEFIGYINQLNPKETYSFDIQNLGSSPVKASFGTFFALPCPLTHIQVLFKNYAFDPAAVGANAVGDGALVANFSGITDYLAEPGEEIAYGLYLCQSEISFQSFSEPLSVNLKPHIHPAGFSDGWLFALKNDSGGIDYVYGVYEPGNSAPSYWRYNCLGNWIPWDTPGHPEMLDFLSALAQVISEYGHITLDVIGFIPAAGDLADGINAIWYTAEENYMDAAISSASIGFGFVTTFRAGEWFIEIESNGKKVLNVFSVIKVALGNSAPSYKAFSALRELERMRGAGLSSAEASRCWNWLYGLARHSGDAENGKAVLKCLDNPDVYSVWQKAANEGFSDEVMTTFFRDIVKDFDNGDGLLALMKSEPLSIRHWKALFDAGVGQDKRIALEILESMNTHFGDHIFLARLGNGSPDAGRAQYIDIIKEYTGRCTTCGNQGYLPLPETPDIYLDAIYSYTNKYAGKPGFQAPAYPSQPYSQDGFYHSMRHMNSDAVEAGKVGQINMRFEEEGLACAGCLFDVRFFQVSPGSGELKFIEYKSYQNAANIPLPQFKNYMGGINMISELKYVFNQGKIPTLSQAKTGMKSVFNSGDNAMEIWNIMSPQLKEDILGSGNADNFSLFLQKINDTESNLYDFVDLF